MTTSPASVTATATTTATTTTTSTATSTPTGNGAHLVTSPCVLHAGIAHRSVHKDTTGDASVTTASCNFGAECIVAPGGPTHAGDGFVSVTCEQSACWCEWRTPTSAPMRETFTLDTLSSDADTCRRLLVDRCMGGRRLESGVDDAGSR